MTSLLVVFITGLTAFGAYFALALKGYTWWQLLPLALLGDGCLGYLVGVARGGRR